MHKNNRMTDSLVANIDQIKEINTASIFKVIEQNAPISRVKISKVSKLAPASVTKITRHLLERGIIVETARQASTGGRCAISLETNIKQINVLSFKIGLNSLVGSLYTLAGTKKDEVKEPLQDKGIEGVIELLRTTISQFIKQEKMIGGHISAIAITLSGLIDPDNGIIAYSPHHKFIDYPLVQEIETHFNIPTYIGNHTRSLARASQYFGAARGTQDSIFISIHNGVGSGIIMNNELMMGVNNNVGEIGHIQVNPAGKKCHCGNFGCLETEISNPTIIETVRQSIETGVHSSITLDNLTAINIFEAAKNNDPLCQKVVTDAANYLAKAISILINILNPEKIIIAGEICHAEDTLFSAIDEVIARQVLPKFQKNVMILPAEIFDDVTIAGFGIIKNAIYDGGLLQKIQA